MSSSTSRRITRPSSRANTRVRVAQGNGPWHEADAKVFLFATDKARYGLRLSHMRGSLPPTFKETKGLTFGFVAETADDRSDGKSANN
jgi:hypothetical protein